MLYLGVASKLKGYLVWFTKKFLITPQMSVFGYFNHSKSMGIGRPKEK